jgi:selenide,water dikinase
MRPPTSPASACSGTSPRGAGVGRRLSAGRRRDSAPARARELARPALPRRAAARTAGYLEPGGLGRFDDAVPADLRDVLLDPQTAGGLCIAVAPARVDDLLRELEARGVGTRAVIGEAVPGGTPGTIFVSR